MERIEEIKQKRQNQFIMNRLQVGTENRNEADLKEIKDFIHLIKAPHGNFIACNLFILFLTFNFMRSILKKAKNPELDRLHEAATKRLEELKQNKQTLVELKKTKNPSKRRDKVEVIMEESDTVAQNNFELIAEEN